jgi:hypothetical protein
MNELKVEFAGTVCVLEGDQRLTFGRDADLEIDTNPYLHRRVGVFRQRNGDWWVSNTGTAIAIEICDGASPSRLTVAPGTSTPLPFQKSIVRFQAGPSVYELNLAIPHSSTFQDVDEPSVATPTIAASDIPLNDEQRLLLVTLAELRLRDRGAPGSAIPANRIVCQRLGWSTTKFNRKLDNLCAKFHRRGVAGLKGDSGALASNRRERLVNHVLTTGLITAADLELLEAFDG